MVQDWAAPRTSLSIRLVWDGMYRCYSTLLHTKIRMSNSLCLTECILLCPAARAGLATSCSHIARAMPDQTNGDPDSVVLYVQASFSGQDFDCNLSRIKNAYMFPFISYIKYVYVNAHVYALANA